MSSKTCYHNLTKTIVRKSDEPVKRTERRQRFTASRRLLLRRNRSKNPLQLRDRKDQSDSQSLIKLADFYNVSIDYLVGRVQLDVYGETRKQTHEAIDGIVSLLEDMKKML